MLKDAMGFYTLTKVCQTGMGRRLGVGTSTVLLAVGAAAGLDRQKKKIGVGGLEKKRGVLVDQSPPIKSPLGFHSGQNMKHVW